MRLARSAGKNGDSQRGRTKRKPGSASARFGGRPLAAGRHSAAILLTDAAGGEVVSLDYKKALSLDIEAGAIRGVRLALPAGTELPSRLKAYVIADVFPLKAAQL